LSDQVLNFGPDSDFLEIGELWSHILKLLERGREAVQEIKS